MKSEALAPAKKRTVERKGTRAQKVVLITDPVLTAKTIGLRYVSDVDPGLRRKRAGKSFTYLDPQGKTVRDAATVKRIKSLVIPPAWNEVWICPMDTGHIQATGRDAKGRKQYRYHPVWQAFRNQTKYHRMISFGEVLPRIRQRVHQALSLRGLPREKVLAAVLAILDRTGIRIGNEEYARTNHSFGLTTMRDEHVDVSGSSVRFEFRGKSGQMHDVGLQDRRLAGIVKRCQDLPGEDLFQYIDEEGRQQKIGSADVNDYLREVSGQDFTAKDFRTWTGTVQAALALAEVGCFESQTGAKKNICQAIKAAAQRLGNKPAVCRKYYVHPAILDSYLEGTLLGALEAEMPKGTESPAALRPEERAVMSVLRQHVARETEAAREKTAKDSGAPSLKRAS